MTRHLSRLASILLVIPALVACPESRNHPEDAGPPAAPTTFVPPRDPVLASRPPRNLDAKFLIGPTDVVVFRMGLDIEPKPIEGKTASLNYDGIRYGTPSSSGGLTVEWQTFGGPQEVAQRLQTLIHEQPKAPQLPEIGPLAFAMSRPDGLSVVFADPPTRSVVTLTCIAPACKPPENGVLDPTGLAKLTGLAKIAQQHVSKPLPP